MSGRVYIPRIKKKPYSVSSFRYLNYLAIIVRGCYAITGTKWLGAGDLSQFLKKEKAQQRDKEYAIVSVISWQENRRSIQSGERFYQCKT